jgi:hypothetical protein
VHSVTTVIITITITICGGAVTIEHQDGGKNVTAESWVARTFNAVSTDTAVLCTSVPCFGVHATLSSFYPGTKPNAYTVLGVRDDPVLHLCPRNPAGVGIHTIDSHRPVPAPAWPLSACRPARARHDGCPARVRPDLLRTYLCSAPPTPRLDV